MSRDIKARLVHDGLGVALEHAASSAVLAAACGPS